MEKEFYKTKEEIESWLNQYKIKNYKLIPSGKYGFVVNISGDVVLIDFKLEKIPLKFDIVSGNFYCQKNNLRNIEFAPQKLGGLFNCSNNLIRSLSGAPNKINGYFDCSNNKLTSLEFCPKTVNRYFDCSFNKIENLLYFPMNVSEEFCILKNEKLGMLQNKDFMFLYNEHLKQLKEVEMNDMIKNMEKISINNSKKKNNKI